jgi:uncharacterized integral membrane protein
MSGDESKQVTAPNRTVSLKAILAGISLVLAAAFVIQNRDEQKVSFLFWDVHAKLWLILLVTVVAGALIGQGVEAWWVHRREERLLRHH